MSEDEKGLDVEDGVVVMRSGLTDEERERLNGVRKQIWRGGYAGLLGGGILGLGNCAMFNVVQTRLSQQFPKHPVVKTLPKLQNKHFVMWTLVSGAVGMFLGAGVEGTRASESLHDIYEKRANEAKNDREVGVEHLTELEVRQSVRFIFVCSVPTSQYSQHHNLASPFDLELESNQRDLYPRCCPLNQ